MPATYAHADDFGNHVVRICCEKIVNLMSLKWQLEFLIYCNWKGSLTSAVFGPISDGRKFPKAPAQSARIRIWHTC